MDFFVFLIPVFIVLVIALAIYGHKKEKERQAALRAWAARHGLYFQEDKVTGFDYEHGEFDCLRQGDNRYAYNIMAGNLEGLESKLFDYHYETHSTDSKGNRTTQHHRFSAVIIGSPFRLQPLVIRPEHVFHKISAAFGWDDIDFESAEFSRRYYVKSPDKRWAYDVIHGRIMEMLLEVKGYYFECDSRSMICYGSSKRFDVAEFEGAFRLAAEILRQVPDHAKERVSHHA